VIEELLIPDGEKVVAGDQLCKIKITDAVDSGASTSPPVTTESPPPPPPQATPMAPPQATPMAPPPPQAAEGPIPTTPPPVPPIPSGPSGSVPPPPSKVRQPSSDGPSTTITSTDSRTEKRVKMTRMRQRIAQRLKDAQNVNAMLTTFNEIDMSNVIQLRKQYQDSFVKKHGLKLGFMSPFVKASCHALLDQPVVNAGMMMGQLASIILQIR
jgi:2-oxoglutarate dehydrogenase E2 component (dihydrolipoamide succinyltransferase)